MSTVPIAPAVFLAVVLSACAGIPHRLEPGAAATVRRTTARTVIPEPRITMTWVRSGYADGSLLGAIVAGSANKSRRTAAETLVMPLQAQTGDINFQAWFGDVLSQTLTQVSWLKCEGVEHVSSRLPPVTESDVRDRSLIQVGTDYNLSPDGTVLIVSSGIGFFAQGQPERPAAAVIVQYRSDEIGAVEDERAIEAWARNGAAAYRVALQEAVAENAKLTRMALDYVAGTDFAGAEVRLTVHLSHARGDFGIKEGSSTMTGTIVEETDRRIVLHTEASFLSLPKSAIDARVVTGRAQGVTWTSLPATPPPKPAAPSAVVPPSVPVPQPVPATPNLSMDERHHRLLARGDASVDRIGR
jgi:hypothetical protein